MSWKTVELGDVCEFTRGLTYSKVDEVEFSNNAVLRATNIDLESNKLNLEEIRYINSSVKINEDKKIKLNDILICTASGSKSHLGKVALINEQLDMAFGGFMAVLRVKETIEAKFLFNYLTSDIFLNHVSRLADGANINNLKFSQIQNLKINLPPLPTQQKIVTKLDAIFAEIDTATAAAETNTKNAEALFQSYLTEVFELEAMNNTSLLGEVCNVIGGGTPSKANEEFYTGTIPWATVRDMSKDNLDMTDYKITEEAVRLSATNIIPSNNVVIATRVGLGKVCILNQDTAINQDLRGVIPKSKDILDVNYLFLWFKFIAEKII